MRPASTTPAMVRVVEDGVSSSRPDAVVTEEPLEIRLRRGQERWTVAVTMRTPGADFELAAGFLFAEGVVSSRGDVRRIGYCRDRDVAAEQRYNVVTVEVAGQVGADLGRLERHFAVTSACGMCGKATLEALELRGCKPVEAGPEVGIDVLYRLPGALRDAQSLFAATGGLHAAGLFTAGGELVALREDVGRHNAVDKLVGWALLDGRVPLGGHVLMVSGRSSYEILQKAVVAAIPVVCAVSAPSSLAVDLARRFGVTLVGFLRDHRCNIYTGEERVRVETG